MAEQEKPDIVGYVFIVASITDRHRIAAQLRRFMKTDPTRYTGAIESGIQGYEPQQIMFYLELPLGIYGDVLNWCQSAYHVGLIFRYNYADAAIKQVGK